MAVVPGGFSALGKAVGVGSSEDNAIEWLARWDMVKGTQAHLTTCT
jgi:hypothetical protein